MAEKTKVNLSPNIILLGIVSFFNDLGSEMIMPILPMFIASLGGGGIAIGLVGGIRESINSILNIFSGYFSDRTGRRKEFVVWGYLSSSAFKLFLGLSRFWQQILIFSGLERIGKGLRSAPRDAIIADSSLEKQRGRSFGIHRMFDTLGAVFGGIATVIVYWFLKFDFRAIILTAAVISFFALLPLILVKAKRNQHQSVTISLGLKKLPQPLRAFILISSIFYLANFSYMFFILRAKVYFMTLYPERTANLIPIFLYILSNVVYALTSIPSGIISDKVGRRKVLACGYFLFALTSLGFIFFESLFAFIILFSLYGIVNALTDSNERAYVSDLAPQNLKATALGTFHAAIGLVSLLEGVIIGFLWQKFSPNFAFIYGAVFTALSGILLFIFKGHLDQKAQIISN